MKTITATICATVIASVDQTDEYPNGYIDVVPTDGFRNANGDQFDTASLRWPLADGGRVVSTDVSGKVLDLPAYKDHSRSVNDMIGGVKSATWDEEHGVPILRIGLTSLERGQEIRTLAQEGFLGHNVSLTYTTDEEDFTYKNGVIYDANVDEVSIVWKGANKDARTVAVASQSSNKEEEMPRTEKEAAKLTFNKEEDREFLDQVTEAVVESIDKNKQPDNDKKEDEPKPADTPKADEDDKKEAASSADKAITAAKTAAATHRAPEGVNRTAGSHMDKVALTAAQFVAYVRKDTDELARLNKIALDTYQNEKIAATINTGTTANGGALVPSAELLAEVYSLVGTYSAVAGDLRVITLEHGDSLDVSTLLTDVIMSEVGTEGGKKDVTSPTFGDGNVSLREFAGIAIVTKKMIRQAAVNVYDILRDSFARAIARKRADMALTDETSGILNKEGVETVKQKGATVTYADIKRMAYAVPAEAVHGAKYYISREVLEAIDTETDANGRDLDVVKLSGDGLTGTFKNGYQFAVEETLNNQDSQVIFGNMSRYGILLRQANVEDETFDTGVVKDGATDVNLLQENKIAERVAFYENVGYPLPGAFAKLVKEDS